MIRDQRHLESAFRHGLRVRLGGASGAKGVLWHCGGGTYWRVRLADGTWVPARDLVVDGPGESVSRCASCELPFLHHTGSGELLCQRCNDEQFGRAVRPEDVHPRRWNLRRSRRRY